MNVPNGPGRPEGFRGLSGRKGQISNLKWPHTTRLLFEKPGSFARTNKPACIAEHGNQNTIIVYGGQTMSFSAVGRLLSVENVLFHLIVTHMTISLKHSHWSEDFAVWESTSFVAR
jgi:hypothetical protein